MGFSAYILGNPYLIIPASFKARNGPFFWIVRRPRAETVKLKDFFNSGT